jgi:hypothetical protein
MSKFVMVLHDSGTFPPDMSPEQIQAVIQRYVAWKTRLAASHKLEGYKLTEGQGRLMRGAIGSPKVTDGPYAEAREVVGGLFILEAANYEEVVELSKDCPHLEFGTIEIREVQPTRRQ